MPYKPKKPCAYPGCPELTDGRYCAKHQKLINKQYEKYNRNPVTRKRYQGEWRRIRDHYIHDHPLCEKCLEEGRFTRAEHVHHILPLSQGGTNEEDNLMSVCKSCHSRIHAEMGDRWDK